MGRVGRALLEGGHRKSVTGGGIGTASLVGGA